MSEMLALIAQMEAAAEGSPALDRAINDALGIDNNFHEHEGWSSSIDAAVRLADRLRPGADIDLEMREMMTDGKVRRVTDATIYGRAYSEEPSAKAYADSPPLALCIAALKARAQGVSDAS